MVTAATHGLDLQNGGDESSPIVIVGPSLRSSLPRSYHRPVWSPQGASLALAIWLLFVIYQLLTIISIAPSSSLSFIGVVTAAPSSSSVCADTDYQCQLTGVCSSCTSSSTTAICQACRAFTACRSTSCQVIQTCTACAALSVIKRPPVCGVVFC